MKTLRKVKCGMLWRREKIQVQNSKNHSRIHLFSLLLQQNILLLWLQSSAPVEIPDWSKIYGKTSKKKKNGTISSSWVDYNAVNHDGYYGNGGNDHHHHHLNGYYDVGDGDDDGDDDDDDMVPPHEYLAKKLARSQISSFSVYEGIGRTLKGRDLSKVRNAILTKTGFLE
ncbi:hypothetical protein BVRB_8g186170 [Beta vulgaris subsp. vulgaris]|nr:hypothetical protein BVRB_8g186170 [Beta vulgaris subsp. vulgaris]